MTQRQRPQSERFTTSDCARFVQFIQDTLRKPASSRGGLTDVVVTGAVSCIAPGAVQSRYQARFSFPRVQLPDCSTQNCSWAYEFPHDYDEGFFDTGVYVTDQLHAVRGGFGKSAPFYAFELHEQGIDSSLRITRKRL